jgi:hypothetical protein
MTIETFIYMKNLRLYIMVTMTPQDILPKRIMGAGVYGIFISGEGIVSIQQRPPDHISIKYGKVYIGKSKCLISRIGAHWVKSNNGSLGAYLSDLHPKYISIKILKYCTSVHQATIYEKKFIIEYVLKWKEGKGPRPLNQTIPWRYIYRKQKVNNKYLNKKGYKFLDGRIVKT